MSDSTPIITDLSDNGPGCREWQELERYVKEYVRQVIRDNLALEKAIREKESATAQGKDKDNQETGHEWERELIRQGLERYRAEPPDSNIRKGIDWLLQRHATLQKCFNGPELEYFRKRHNALVLRYIIATPMNRHQIEKRLGIKCYGSGNVIEQGISELAQIFFEYRE